MYRHFNTLVNIKAKLVHYNSYDFLYIVPIIILLCIFIFRKKIHKIFFVFAKFEYKRMYDYEYVNNNISITYFLKNKNHTNYLHAKFYVLDEKIVYLGSLNFTNNGINHSIETTIRIEDADLAKQFSASASNLYKHISYHNVFNYYGRKSLAKTIYND